LYVPASHDEITGADAAVTAEGLPANQFFQPYQPPPGTIGAA